MRKSSRAATAAALGFAALVIPLSLAVAQGIVPCTGIGCQLCSLAQLAQNIIKFTILLAIPLSALLFAYAGALYITARGDTGKIEKAHEIFGKVALGFILALSGYLIVNTILVTIAKPSAFASGSSFFSISCLPDSLRPKTANLSDVLGTNTPTIVSVSLSCPADSTPVETGGCYNPTTNQYTQAVSQTSTGLTCSTCVPLDSSIPGYNRSQTCSAQTNGACQIDAELNDFMKNFSQQLCRDSSHCGYVSEAWPPTRSHQSADQMTGNSLDWSGCNANNGVTNAGAQAGCIQATANAANNNGLRAVYEVANPADRQALLNVNPSLNVIYVPGITGNHFSIYKNK